MLDETRNRSQTPAQAVFPGPRFGRIRPFIRDALKWSFYLSGSLKLLRGLAHGYVLQGTDASKLPRLRRNKPSKFGILCYHRVGTEGIPIYSRLHPKKFEAQMRYLQGRYRLVSLKQLCQELLDARPVPPTLAITFDDGYRDLYSFAFPVLQKYQIPATVYLIANCVETGEAPWYDRIFSSFQAIKSEQIELDLDCRRSFVLSSFQARAAAAWEIVCYLRTIPDEQRRVWCSELEKRYPPETGELFKRMLNWEQIRAMHRAGIDFGAHTMTHPVVSRLKDTDFERELRISKQMLESGLQAPIDDFAYPFGKEKDRNSAVREFLVKAGYRSAVTTDTGHNAPGADLYALRRMQIGDTASIADFAVEVCRMLLETREDFEIKQIRSFQRTQMSGAKLRERQRV